MRYLGSNTVIGKRLLPLVIAVAVGTTPMAAVLCQIECKTVAAAASEHCHHHAAPEPESAGGEPAATGSPDPDYNVYELLSPSDYTDELPDLDAIRRVSLFGGADAEPTTGDELQHV